MLARLAKAEPPLPSIPTNNYNILNFGAYGDSVSNNTVAISNTINAAGVTGGTVEIPANGSLSTYLCGPITLKNNLNLQIDTGATLKMLPYGSYPTNPSPPDFISAKNLHDVKLSGSGTIQGQGTNWWIAYDATGIARPKAMFAPDACKTVLVENVTMRDPPNTHISIRNASVNVTVRGVTMITANDTISANTDGIDVDATNCLIRSCSISVGDDHVALGGGSRNVTITNCMFGNGHGISIGSHTDGGGVLDLLVSNCTMTVAAGLSSGIRMKSGRDRGGLCQNLVYRDLTLTNVQNPIFLSSYYPDSTIPSNPTTDTGSSVTSTTPIWRNITISNVSSVAASGRNAGRIYGLPEMLISNVTLSKVTSKGDYPFDMYNIQGIRFVDSQVNVPSSTNTFNVYNVELTITNSVLTTNLLKVGGWNSAQATNRLAIFNANVAITDSNILRNAATITLGGGTLSFTQNAASFSNSLNVVSASTLAVASGSNAMFGAIGGAGTLTLNLPANTRLTLRGNSPGFGGALIVSNSGTLLVNGSFGTGAVIVASAANLGGTGVIGGPVTVNGTLAPGSSVGSLTISNNLTVNGGAVLQYELGTNSDQTVVSGDLSLDGTLNITDAGGFTNTTYLLFSYGGTLTYNGLTVGTTPSTNFTYTISTNVSGQVNLIVNDVAPPPLDPFVTWQLQYFGCTNLASCPQAAGNADFDGDGMSNTNEFLAGTNPTNATSALRIISVAQPSNDMVITWTTAGGRTNAVQATADMNTIFADITTDIVISGSGDVTTNYVDGGATTNTLARYYRVRLVL